MAVLFTLAATLRRRVTYSTPPCMTGRAKISCVCCENYDY